MSQTLIFKNFGNANVLKQTNLTQLTNAGTTALAVADNNDFATNDYSLIGNQDAKNSEMALVSSITGADTITIPSPGTILQHQNYEPVLRLFGNQIKVYRAANVDGTQPADSAFSSIATISIDPNEAFTRYTDAGGGGNYWYKYTIFNSSNSNETDLASARAVRGSFTVNYCSIDEIREEAGFKYATYINDIMIDSKRQAAQDEINGALAEFYAVPLQPPINDQIRDLTIRLSAALLLKQQYGETVANNDVNGKNKYDDAQAELQKFITKQRLVVTKDGKSLAGTGAAETATGWPDASTAMAARSEGGAPRVFRMGDIQGQPMTHDSSGNPVGNLYYGRKW